MSDASLRGMTAAEAMLELSKELEINVRNTYLVINRVIGEMTPAIRAKADGMGVPLLAAVPYDPQLVEFDGAGRPLVELPADALVSVAVEGIASKLLEQVSPVRQPLVIISRMIYNGMSKEDRASCLAAR